MRRKRGIVGSLLGWFLAIVLLAVVAASLRARALVREVHRRENLAALTEMARLLAAELASVSLEDEAAVDALCKRLGRAGGTRFTVVLASGRVIGDSVEEPAAMDDHAGRPELRAAFAGGVGDSVRYSHTVQADMMYVAVPVPAGGRAAAAARAARPLARLRESLRLVQNAVLVTGGAVALLAALGCLVAARRLARPVEDLRRGAERLACGDLSHRLREPAITELAELARCMNRMAEDLAGRMESLTRQRNEIEAVLSSMAEGVVAVDRKERVIMANRSAAALLELPAAEVQGRPIQELVRNPALGQILEQTLRQAGPVEGEMVLYGKAGERRLRVRAAGLGDGTGPADGVVLVLEDVTRLHRLEQVRRDFVANVSHELRTPITSLKGFVETLLDGALHEPENAEKFLRIIQKQADRLDAIVADLLVLARVEQAQEGRGEVKPEIRTVPLAEVLQSAVSLCQPKAARRQIQVALSCQEGLRVDADARLLEQAVVNLLDNAINYSEPGRPVEVVGRREGGEILIDVRDQGCGIAPNHLPRIFERFYRVDKSRSREAGGTGLGLSIVKHILNLHGGSVTVASEVGKGSVFTLHLPASPREEKRP